MQLVGGETGALEQGTGLIGKDAEIHAALFAQKQGTQSGSIPRGSQGTGVAVGENAVSLFDKAQPVLRDGPAHGDILLVDGPALLAQGVQNLRHGFSGVCGYHTLHTVERPAEVHGSGTGGIQILLLAVEFLGKGGGVLDFPLAGQGIDAVGGADADGRGAPDLKELDGVVHLLRCAEG